MPAKREDPFTSESLTRPGAALGHTVIVKNRTGSTNDDAREMAELGARHGAVVAADEQTAGRGRGRRTWHSPPGRNLLFSVVLRTGPALGPAGLITLGAGVAVVEGLGALADLPFRIKWPNDVRVAGKKIAGILAEAGGRETIEYVVLGIGLNVNLAAEEMPAEIRDSATSLLMEGRFRPRALVFHRVLERLEKVYGELERGNARRVLARWDEYSEVKGKRVRAEAPGGAVTGAVLGIREDGALRVREEATQTEQAILAGDLIILD